MGSCFSIFVFGGEGKGKIVLVLSYWYTDLDTVIASGNLAVLHLNIGRGMGELALRILARTFVALEFATHLQLQPARVLAIEQAVHINNVGHCSGNSSVLYSIQ